MKKNWMYILLITMVIIAVNLLVKINLGKNVNVITAFESGNYSNSHAVVESFFYYGDVYLNEEDKKEILDTIIKKLKIDNDYIYETSTVDNDRISSVQYAFRGGELNIELLTRETRINSNVYSLNHFVTVKMEFDNSMESAWYYKNELEEILAGLPDMSVEPEVTISMQGEINGELSPISKKKMCKQIFSQLGAKIVLDNWNESSTMYGFSEEIKEYKTIGGKKINVNVAFGYDEERKVTNIYVATPIYNGDF